VTESWLQLSVRANPSHLDAIANFLIERGSPGVVMKNRGVEAFFAHSPKDTALKREVGRFLAGIARISSNGIQPGARWSLLGDGNWQSSWKRFIKPRRIGKRFWVTPPWLIPPNFRQRQVITIEPGMAFGTGTHATTRSCLEYLEQVAEFFGDRPFTALDLGTGAGILAIALVKLGARQVWAIDNDPIAVKVARENLSANDALKRVRLSGKNLNEIRGRFPVVVANLTAETLLDLAPAIVRKVSPRGFLILSGILHSKSNAIARRFGGRFRIAKRRRRQEWVTLLLQQK
jgi:ribosomal protein L11 methyltransferase